MSSQPFRVFMIVLDCGPFFHASRRDLRVGDWLKAGFTSNYTDKRIRRDSFTSVAGLELAIDLYVAHHDIEPMPFSWTARASDILAKVTHAKAALAVRRISTEQGSAQHQLAAGF